MLANTKGEESLFEINYSQFEIDLETKATYNIKDTTSVWEELQAGQGIVVRAPKPNSPIAINNLTLGYFWDSTSKYLKPIYIFEGTTSVDQLTPDFVAVLPAIAVENKAE